MYVLIIGILAFRLHVSAATLYLGIYRGWLYISGQHICGAGQGNARREGQRF